MRMDGGHDDTTAESLPRHGEGPAGVWFPRSRAIFSRVIFNFFPPALLANDAARDLLAAEPGRRLTRTNGQPGGHGVFFDSQEVRNDELIGGSSEGRNRHNTCCSTRRLSTLVIQDRCYCLPTIANNYHKCRTDGGSHVSKGGPAGGCGGLGISRLSHPARVGSLCKFFQKIEHISMSALQYLLFLTH